MKLRNKQTGEIIDIHKGEITLHYDQGRKTIHFKRLEDLEEWEDYEEPKKHYSITQFGDVVDEVDGYMSETIDEMKQIGNYFNTREEAEKAVEKLKAWKRLKELGFRFIDWELDMKTIADGKIWFDIGLNTEWNAEQLLKLKPEAKESLDIIFGGEE